MKYYIFNTEQEAVDYDNLVVANSNYPEGVNWANPKKHPTQEKWAILPSGRVVLKDKESEELSEDWNSEIL